MEKIANVIMAKRLRQVLDCAGAPALFATALVVRWSGKNGRAPPPVLRSNTAPVLRSGTAEGGEGGHSRKPRVIGCPAPITDR